MIKFLPKIIILSTIITLFIIFGVMVLQANQHENQQASTWVDSLRKSILPQLIESDYVPLANKLDLVKKTKLFKSINVYNSKDRIVASFGGTTENICNPEAEKIISDDTGNAWGKICYSVDLLSTLRIFFAPFGLIALILIALSFFLARSIATIIKSEEKKIIAEQEKAGLIQSVASQLAHDIRSPLAALEMVVNLVRNQMPADERMLMQSAVNRIKDIANNLLSRPTLIKPILANPSTNYSDEQLGHELIALLIESVISEIRVRFMNTPEIQIECEIIDDAFMAFSFINSIDFKRAITNLINNSIEAKDKHVLKINLRVYILAKTQQVIIEVEDNGKGIPSSIIAKIGNPGVSYGKGNLSNAGTGLGVSHAKKTVETWKGIFKIESVENQGTLCKIILPLSLPAAWFFNKIEVSAKTLIVVCDDDQAIHHIWDKRFSDNQVVHFRTTSELQKFHNENISKSNDVLYLVDYTFEGESRTGLEIILELGINVPATKSLKPILVTSYYEDKKVRQACMEHNIFLLPKTMSGLIPISSSL
ncbi:MAG: HAMP domain-containing sensor histidine kinase [Bacteriovoracaceae bacterium]|nr:HAMP domain-containing sensor histidine kinase [Bacteriovoracaceae bacterium]